MWRKANERNGTTRVPDPRRRLVSTAPVDHTIVELPSRVAGDIVGQDLSARIRNGGGADRAYFRVVSPSA